MALLDHVNGAINSVKRYVPGKPIEDVAREYNLNLNEIVKLASNESPLGVSPLALKAIKEVAEEMHIYPDGESIELRRKLSKFLNVEMEQIVIGDGAEEIIRFISHSFLSPSTSIVISKHTFPIYKIAANMFGSEIIEVPMKGLTYDLEGILNNIKENTRVIYICNPNNPTGSMVENHEISDFMSKVPDDILVVFDEAYGDIAQKEMPDTLSYTRAKKNVLVLKTFSKAYGIAGLRVGYGITTQKIAEVLNKARLAFNCNRMAQAAAIAALDDHDYVKKSKEVYKNGIKQIKEACEELHLEYEPPFANFILIKVGNATEVFEKLQKMGIIVRPMGGCQLPEWIRVTIGTYQDNSKFIQSLQKIISKK
jgi:histidinol-phosphate aminotransferase